MGAKPFRILICGMSRGGTSAMMRSLNTHPDCAAYGETVFFGRLWREPGPDGKYDTETLERIAKRFENQKMGPIEGEGALDFDSWYGAGQCVAAAIRKLDRSCTPDEVFTTMGEAIAAHHRKRYWVEKTPQHLWHLDRIREQIGPFRVIVMLRDPEAFLLSYKHQGDRRSPKERKRFRRLYHPAAASWVCRRYIKSAIKSQKVYGDDVLICFLENLISEPDVQLHRVTEHLEIDSFPPGKSFAKANSSFTKEKRPELTPAERMWVNYMAGASARQLGLKCEKPPFAPFRFAWSVLTLPFSMMRAMLVVPHIIRMSS